MIRDAKFADIPRILGLLQSGFKRSHYAKHPTARIDEAEAKKLLLAAIQRHGRKHGGACFVQVAETDGVISGLILGTLARAYSIGTHLMATDLFWLASPIIDPSEPKQLMQNMIEWAKSCPNVIEIKCGTTSIINNDPKDAGKVLERLGLTRYGELYRLELEA